MTEVWIKANLAKCLSPDGVSITLSTTPQGVTIGCTIASMVKMFGRLSTVDYATLSATPQAETGGWKPIFDAWKAAGYIA